MILNTFWRFLLVSFLLYSDVAPAVDRQREQLIENHLVPKKMHGKKLAEHLADFAHPMNSVQIPYLAGYIGRLLVST